MYPESVTLSRAEMDLLIEPWCHDFTVLGLKTPQRQGIFPDNQISNQPILFPLIDQAVRLSRLTKNPLRGIELFCAEGF